MEKVLSHRSAADTNEHVICSRRCLVFSITPELTTTGTITLRDAAATGGSNVLHVCAIGLTQAGKTFPKGMLFENGVTIQTSVNTDRTMITYIPV